MKEFFEKVDLEKNQQTTESMKNFPGGKEIKQKTSKYLNVHESTNAIISAQK